MVCTHASHLRLYGALLQTTPPTPPFRPLDGSEGRRCALYGFTSCCCCRRGNLGSILAADVPVIDLKTDAGGCFWSILYFCYAQAKPRE